MMYSNMAEMLLSSTIDRRESAAQGQDVPVSACSWTLGRCSAPAHAERSAARALLGSAENQRGLCACLWLAPLHADLQGMLLGQHWGRKPLPFPVEEQETEQPSDGPLPLPEPVSY